MCIRDSPFDTAHTQPVRDRRIDLHGFERLVALLALGQELEGTGIVQSVSQLDEDNADILRPVSYTHLDVYKRQSLAR